jgi:protein CrcB
VSTGLTPGTREWYISPGDEARQRLLLRDQTARINPRLIDLHASPLVANACGDFGGSLGALARYLLRGWILDRTGPSIIALFVINVSGAFALGLILTLAEERNLIGPEARPLLTTGFLSTYATFSSWMFESVQ